MSTDQQWAGNGSRQGIQHEQIHERRVPIEKRPLPFAGLFVMALVVIPTVEVCTWTVGHFLPSYRDMLVIGWMLTGFIAAVIALSIGRMVTKRVPFVYWHAAITTFLWGLASAITTAYGLWQVPPWTVTHLFGSVLIAVSWSLYRIDSLRTAASTGGGRDVWGEVIGLKTSRPRKVTTTDTHAIIEVKHGPGETRKDVQGAAAKLESAMNAVSGRTTVTDTEDGRAGSSTIRLARKDAFAEWLPFPGPSHPGGSFAYPLRTAYYETGEEEWFSFAASLRSPHTEFRSEMDSFFGAAGTTGSGKSGGINNLVCEALTRCDVIVGWVDREKIEQNAGWCLDMLGMAGNREAAKDVTVALRKLAQYRVRKFGQVALDAVRNPNAPDDDIGRKWTPQLAEETGEAAVLVIIDEADTAIQGEAWEWLSARGRSLGIFLYAVTPRCSTAEVPAVVRGSIASWKTYSIGDNYSGGFTLSSETMDAGADPSRLREPGLHYLDKAPGVERRMYSTLAREYHSTARQLRAHVLRYRGVTFTPATFTAEAVEAMGAEFERCNPNRLLNGGQPNLIRDLMRATAGGQIEATPQEVEQARRILAANGEPDNMTPADRAGTAGNENEEGDPVQATAEGVDEEAGLAAPIDPASQYDDDELAIFNRVDTSKPITVSQPRDIPMDLAGVGKPAWSPDDTDREFDRALVAFARRGKREFSNADVQEEMRCRFVAATCSRRLDALVSGDRTAPGGLTVERLGRGKFALVGDLDETYTGE